MPTIKVFTSAEHLAKSGFRAAVPALIPAMARYMDTAVDKVHIMGIACVTGAEADVAHVQVEYLPLNKRTEAFIATASGQIARHFAEFLGQDVRIRSWPTHGVAMAEVTVAEVS